MRVIVTLPPNSKDERCDLYARRRIHTKPVERGQCQFEVRAKFPNNVYIRVRVKQSVSVDGKSYQVQTKWRSIKLITMKRKSPKMVYGIPSMVYGMLWYGLGDSLV